MIKAVFFFITLNIVMCSCTIVSSNKFAPEDKLISCPPELLGNWSMNTFQGEKVEDQKLKEWEFKENEVIAYEKNNKKSVFGTYYFRVEKELFCISYLKQDLESESELISIHLSPVYLCSKIKLSDKSLVIEPMSEKKIKELIELKEITKVSKPDDNRSFVIYEEPSLFYNVIKKYTNNGLFSTIYEFKFTKK